MAEAGLGLFHYMTPITGLAARTERCVKGGMVGGGRTHPRRCKTCADRLAGWAVRGTGPSWSALCAGATAPPDGLPFL